MFLQDDHYILNHSFQLENQLKRSFFTALISRSTAVLVSSRKIFQIKHTYDQKSLKDLFKLQTISFTLQFLKQIKSSRDLCYFCFRLPLYFVGGSCLTIMLFTDRDSALSSNLQALSLTFIATCSCWRFLVSDNVFVGPVAFYQPLSFQHLGKTIFSLGVQSFHGPDAGQPRPRFGRLLQPGELCVDLFLSSTSLLQISVLRREMGGRPTAGLLVPLACLRSRTACVRVV